MKPNLLTGPFRTAALDSAAMISALVVVAALAAVFGSTAMQRVVTGAAITLTVVMGLQIFSGNSGIVSFGHSAFVGIGAYAVGIMTMPAAVLPMMPVPPRRSSASGISAAIPQIP